MKSTYHVGGPETSWKCATCWGKQKLCSVQSWLLIPREQMKRISKKSRPTPRKHQGKWGKTTKNRSKDLKNMNAKETKDCDLDLNKNERTHIWISSPGSYPSPPPPPMVSPPPSPHHRGRGRVLYLTPYQKSFICDIFWPNQGGSPLEALKSRFWSAPSPSTSTTASTTTVTTATTTYCYDYCNASSTTTTTTTAATITTTTKPKTPHTTGGRG